MKKKILVIDDSLDMRKLLTTVLSIDYEVLALENGKNIFQDMSHFIPDLIILDIMLPDLDGYEICSLVKQNENYAMIPIVFISGKSGSSSRSTGYSLGAVNYLEKPFELNELLSMVKSIIHQAEGIGENNLTLGNVKLQFDRQEVRLNDEIVNVTKSEFIILAKFLKNPGTVLSRDILLESISTDNLDSSDRSIDNHVSSLRKKLKNADFKLRSVYGTGYKLVDGSVN